MDGDDDAGAGIVAQDLAPHFGDRDRPSEHAARRGRAERHDHVRLHDGPLALQPPAAGLDLGRVRPLVPPPLAALLELEMLDRVGDEDLFAVDAGLRDGAVEDAAGRADEGPAPPGLLVAPLLAD